MRKYSSSPLSSLLSRGSHASSAESASFEDFPSGILYPLASLSLLTRVIFMTCSYFHIPSVSKIGFPSKVRQDIPEVQWDALILKQDSFPKQSSHPDLIVSSRFLIHLCQLVVCDPWSLILSSPQSSMCSLPDFFSNSVLLRCLPKQRSNHASFALHSQKRIASSFSETLFHTHSYMHHA